MAICCGSNGQYLISHKSRHIGTGWYKLVDELHVALMKIDPGYVTMQVKEKFGTLRIYIGSRADAAHELVREYEKRSGTICEICGEPGKLYANSWYRTLCEKHEAERTKRGLATLLHEGWADDKVE